MPNFSSLAVIQFNYIVLSVSMSLNTGGLDKTSQRGVWFPYLRWCKYLLPEGWTGYPPQPKSSFCLQHSLLLTVPFSIMYLSVNEIVSLPQVKIFLMKVVCLSSKSSPQDNSTHNYFENFAQTQKNERRKSSPFQKGCISASRGC